MHPPFRYLHTLVSCVCPLCVSPLLYRLNSLSSLSLSSYEMLQSLNHFRSPSFSSLRYLCVSPVLGAHNWTQHSRCSISSAEQKAGISTLSLLVTLHLARSRMAVTSVVARARCWLRFHLLPTRTPGPFCAKLFPATSLQPSVC